MEKLHCQNLQTEGLNNKLKLTRRNPFGFKSFEVTKLALSHIPGDLQKPELPHKFIQKYINFNNYNLN